MLLNIFHLQTVSLILPLSLMMHTLAAIRSNNLHMKLITTN